MSAEITINGLDRLLAKIDAYAQSVEVKADQAVNDAGETATTEAQSLARVDTGRMRDATVHTHTHLESVVSNDTPYAVYNEFGTYKMAAQPFMHPGFEVGRKQLQEACEEVIKL